MNWAKWLPIIFQILEFILKKAQASEKTLDSVEKLKKSCEKDDILECKKK